MADNKLKRVYDQVQKHSKRKVKDEDIENSCSDSDSDEEDEKAPIVVVDESMVRPGVKIITNNKSNGGRLFVNGQPFWKKKKGDDSDDDNDDTDRTIPSASLIMQELWEHKINLPDKPVPLPRLDPYATTKTMSNRDKTYFNKPNMAANIARSLLAIELHDAKPKKSRQMNDLVWFVPKFYNMYCGVEDVKKVAWKPSGLGVCKKKKKISNKQAKPRAVEGRPKKPTSMIKKGVRVRASSQIQLMNPPPPSANTPTKQKKEKETPAEALRRMRKQEPSEACDDGEDENSRREKAYQTLEAAGAAPTARTPKKQEKSSDENANRKISQERSSDEAARRGGSDERRNTRQTCGEEGTDSKIKSKGASKRPRQERSSDEVPRAATPKKCPSSEDGPKKGRKKNNRTTKGEGLRTTVGDDEGSGREKPRERRPRQERSRNNEETAEEIGDDPKPVKKNKKKKK